MCFSFLYTTFILLTKVSCTKFKFKLYGKNGNYNSPSEEHLKNSKTNGGSYLDLEISTHVKIFEIYLVKQSPKIMISYPPNPPPPLPLHGYRYLCCVSSAIYLYLFTFRTYSITMALGLFYLFNNFFPACRKSTTI